MKMRWIVIIKIQSDKDSKKSAYFWYFYYSYFLVNAKKKNKLLFCLKTREVKLKIYYRFLSSLATTFRSWKNC